MERVETAYQFPARLLPGHDVPNWNSEAPVALNVMALMRKP